jgi:hypothetical protein
MIKKVLELHPNWNLDLHAIFPEHHPPPPTLPFERSKSSQEQEQEQAAPEKTDAEIIEASDVAAALDDYAGHKDKEEVQKKAKEGNASNDDELVLTSEEDEMHNGKNDEAPI